MAWKEDENGNMVRVNIGGQSKIKPMGEQVAALHKVPKRKGWPKGKSRKPQVEQLKEIEKRIQLAANLSEEEKSEARQRARDHVLKKRKEKAIDQYFEAAVKEEEREFEPDEQYEDYTVDLPEYTPFIKINNVIYFHGITYEVSYKKARSMADLQARAWEHDREKDGKRRKGDIGRDPFNRGVNAMRNTSMSAQSGAVTRTDNLRAPRL